MSDLLKLFELDWRNGVLFISAVVIITVFLIQKWEYIISKFGITTKRKMAEEKQNRDIEELKEHSKKSDENFEKIIDYMDKLQASVNDLSNEIKQMQEDNKRAEIVRIKDRVSEAYNRFKQTGQWHAMEKEAFDGLIMALNEAGEHNSFCNEIAYPRSREWIVIDE